MWAELRALPITALSGKETSPVIGPEGHILTTLLRDRFSTGQERPHNNRPTSKAMRSRVEEKKLCQRKSSES